MERIRDFLKYYKKQFIWGPFFKLLEAIFELLLPLLMARIIDEGIVQNNQSVIVRYGLLMVVLSISGYLFSLTCQYFASVASQGVGTITRNRVYAHINQLSQEQVQHIGANTLTTRLTSDVNQIQLAVAMLIRLAVRAPFIILGSIFLALMINTEITMIFIGVMVLVSIILFITTKLSVPFYQTIQATLDKLTLVLSENISGVRVIRAFSNQTRETNRFNEVAKEVKEKQISVGKIIAMINPLTYLIVNIGIVLVIYAGGYQVNQGTLSAGEVIALVNYLTQIFLALVVLASILVIFTRGIASANRINQILAIQPLFDEGTINNLQPYQGAQLQFKDVEFTYSDASKPFIQSLSFSLNKGETLGIIGGTGSGKSCVALLMSHLYQQTAGEIYFEGQPISSYTNQYLRQEIALVPQKSVLFAGSLRFNLTLGIEAASDQQIQDALITAQSTFVNQWPQRLDAMIEQGGRNLSGGQRQRLSIARALVQSPSMIILDDSSSALDYTTDAALRQALSEMPLTKVIISQRISSLRHADHILVLDNGHVAGYGSHQDLMNSCALYQEIAASQQSKEENHE